MGRRRRYAGPDSRLERELLTLARSDAGEGEGEQEHVAQPEQWPIRRAEDDPGWGHYANTVIEFRRGRRRARLDCRVAVDAAVRRDLAVLGLAGAFVVLTACDPGGSRQSVARNRERTGRLAHRLRAFGTRPIRADGGSPDRTHVELGWGAALDALAARRLAAADGQSAIFRFDGAAMWIDPVLVDAVPIRLPAPSHGWER